MQTSSDYGAYLANEASPLVTTTIVEKCTQKLVEDWNKMRAQVPFPKIPCTPMHGALQRAQFLQQQGYTWTHSMAAALAIAGRGDTGAIHGLLHVWAHDRQRGAHCDWDTARAGCAGTQLDACRHMPMAHTHAAYTCKVGMHTQSHTHTHTHTHTCSHTHTHDRTIAL